MWILVYFMLIESGLCKTHEKQMLREVIEKKSEFLIRFK